MSKQELTEIVSELVWMIEGLRDLRNFPSEYGWNETREAAPQLHAICLEELKNKRVSTKRIRQAVSKTKNAAAIKRVAAALSWTI